MNKIKSQNKSFGILFFIIFLIISVWPLLSNSSVRYWSLFISIIFLLLTIFNSSSLTPANKLWMMLGYSLGSIISPIVMGIIFFLVVTPISLLMRLFGKDTMNLKMKNQKTYWIDKKDPKKNMRNQF
tara:strand:+ start:262 stop:642 length:381 start_codon:yes stop_codon:yes gene_type:complete